MGALAKAITSNPDTTVANSPVGFSSSRAQACRSQHYFDYVGKWLHSCLTPSLATMATNVRCQTLISLAAVMTAAAAAAASAVAAMAAASVAIAASVAAEAAAAATGVVAKAVAVS